MGADEVLEALKARWREVNASRGVYISANA
jgi:hypothetical protein